MAPRTLPVLRADAGLSQLAALALPAAALEEWADGGWHDLGALTFAAVWVTILGLVLFDLAVAFRDREGRARALVWLALVTLANPWASPVIQVVLGIRAIHGVRLQREIASNLGRHVFSGRGLRFAAAVTGLALFGFGWLFTAVEDQPGLTVGDGVWWAMVTAATVGYGDVVPTTPAGRLIGAILMVLGIVVVGLLTGAVAERFVRNKRIENEVIGQLDELSIRLERIEARLAPKTDRS
jgi:voltage-gated potassium channel